MATIQAAIDRANAAGQGADIYVAGGTYVESLTLRTRVSVYGGFSPTTWLRDSPANVTVVNSPSTAVIANGASSLTLDGLTIRSASSSTPGGSSIAISLVNSSNVVISRNAITAGAGAAGANGSAGTPGIPGFRGANAFDATAGCVTGPGGAGGDGPGLSGGAGGGGKTGTGDAGAPGAGLIGGQGGSGGGPGLAGQPGRPVTFEAGAGPAGASSTLDFGAVTATGGYVPASGTRGGDGAPGSGGGCRRATRGTRRRASRSWPARAGRARSPTARRAPPRRLRRPSAGARDI